MNYILKRVFCPFLVFIVLGCGSDGLEVSVEKHGDIFINQIGYLIGEEKFFLTTSQSPEFFLCAVGTKEILYRGETTDHKDMDSASGMTLRKGDFSEFDESGDYYIVLGDLSGSHHFFIGQQLYDAVRDLSLKSFYYQRSGIDLEEPLAGQFHRPAGHVDPLEYHHSSPASGTADVTGGWYDAGDYGRYIIPGAVSLGIMMAGYERYPEKFSSDDSGIPESGNGTPDFLDEMRFELEWMLKMQYREEGVFTGALPYMVNSREYVWEMPHVNSQPQFIYDFSSIATADFAAVMAQASRLFISYDTDFSKKCLDAAEMAWLFLQNHEPYPAGGFQRPDDTATGGYAESASLNRDDRDDRLWAAVELFRTTGRDELNQYAIHELGKKYSFSGNMNWADTSGFPQMSYLFAEGDKVDKTLQNQLNDQLLVYCDKLLDTAASEGFHVVLSPDEYEWGSNGELMTRANYLIFAYLKSGDAKYRSGAFRQLHYILGLNPLNTSYVSGVGSVYPLNIHHAAMAADGIDEPFPGFVAGGPNSRLHGDFTLPKLFDSNTPPALCYADHVDSWASNENCITYNAPLIPLAAFFSEI